MRNLKVLRRAPLHTFKSLPLSRVSWDIADNSAICAYGPTETEPVIQLRRSRAHGSEKPQISNPEELIASWDALCPLPDLKCDAVINLHHLSHANTTCLVLAGGDIVIVRGEPLADQDKIEIVGSIDAGITAASWAPDEELLVVSTRVGTLLYMTADFEVVSDVAFKPEDADLSKHVSVGWGKAETQFKGKRAKALRDPTMPEHVELGKLSEEDRGGVIISWRGDGAFLAVNAIEGARRMIRIYSRDGALEGVTEPVDGLEGALSWRPAGNLIAGVKRRENGATVVFFERNGLQHGEFDIRMDHCDERVRKLPISLSWSFDSTVLGVCLDDIVQLYMMGNYHYYLKQEFTRGSMASLQEIAEICWHPEQTLQFLCHSNKLYSIQFDSSVCTASTTPPNDYGLIAVIDGCTLKLTPFKTANVPPPMGFYENTFDSPILDVAINADCTKIALLHEETVTLLSHNEETNSGQAPQIIETFPLNRSPRRLRSLPRQIAFDQEQQLFILCTDAETGQDYVVELPSYRSVVPSGDVSSSAITHLLATMGDRCVYVQSGTAVIKLFTERAIDSDSGSELEDEGRGKGVTL